MDQHHTPNHIPASKRFIYVLFSLFLLGYGGCGLWANDLEIPGRHGRIVMRLHGVPAWIMYGAFICACVVMLSVVVDHYDKRNNETQYKNLADLFRILGCCFVGLSLVVAALQ